MNQKTKVFALASITLLALVFMSMFSSAILISPATSGLIKGTAYTFDATNTTLPVMVNCSFYAKSTSTGNSTWTLLGVGYNSTYNPGNINKTATTIGIEDSNDYVINATCKNVTGSFTDSLSTSVTVDNTIPQAPSSLSPATSTLVAAPGTQTFSTTVTARNTTRCTFTKGINGGNYQTYTATHTGATCTYSDTSFTDSSINGNYYWYMTASDGTNSTSSATNILTIQIPGSNGGSAGTNQNSGTGTPSESNTNTIFWGIVILLAIGLIVYMVKKK